MSFVRPEARIALWRWREALTGAGMLLLGLWWGFGVAGWIVNAVGGALALLGAALIALGVQRGRFRSGTDGPGVVQVVEGRVAYFGPLTGGAVNVAELSRLSLDHHQHPATWVLHQPGVEALHIPVTAKGAEALFDAFAILPGLRTEYMLRALQSAADGETLIWQKDGARPLLQ